MTLPSPLQWVALLYRGVTPPAGFVEFRFLKSGTRAWMPYPTFEGHPDEFHLTGVPKGQDAYWGVSLRQTTQDGKAANCHPTHLVWTDIDLKDHPEIMHGQTDVENMTADELAEYKAELLSQVLTDCEAQGLPPRAIVDSGHGLQVYWARRARSTFEDTEAYNRGLMLAFGGDEKSMDVARILRLPGTLNLKNKARPLPVQVLFEDADAWVERDALEAIKPAPAPKVAPAPAPRTAATIPASATQLERWAARALEQEIDELRATPEGGRNHALNRAAFNLGTIVGAGALDEVQVRQELREAAQAIGLEPSEISDTLDSGLSGGKQKPRDLSGVGQKPPTAGRGTIGKSEGQPAEPVAVKDILDGLPDKPSLANYRDLVLASFHERELIYRYHQVWRNWWQYQLGVYIEVPDEVMAQQIDLTLQSYGFTLKNAQITEILTKIGRDAMIGSRTVDQGPWELNTRSGILNLQTGQLYAHTPDYYSIIQSAAWYRPETVALDFLAFLRQAVPDEGDRRLLQMFSGLCLTGETSPQRALLLVGDGGTGKSTFVRVLQAVLGNLATSSALENIKDGSFLVGTLVGKRLCVVSELQRNVDWLPFKRVTGEDQISVDVKNKTPYTTKLDLKLIILSNVMPFLGDDTSNSSLMRRFLPVAFNVKPEKPDPTLEARLTDPDELPGVLNWMIEGLRMLEAAGMRFPAGDTAALAREIVEESNRVVTFLRDECRYTPDIEANATELYTAYRKWCAETGHKPLSSTSFAKQLVAAGKHFGKVIERTRNRIGTFYRNVETSTAPGGWEDEA
ncbi:phage/plasmid primase, P4 family [Deinococcus navajonensis]|uniref:Phage/plasmid primase, P4 family n=1 Tax=Deinococcus navajonensis TaxID=309884 RepID=A0ABV8XN54_9DEIO